MSRDPHFSFRSSLVFWSFVLLGISIFGRILWIQSAEHDRWEVVGENYKSSVRSITPARGQIYACNGSVLSTSIPVYELRWDSKSEAIDWNAYESEMDSLCLGFSRILGQTPRHYQDLLRKGRNLGRRNTLIGRTIPHTDQQELRKLPFISEGRYKSGFIFERTEKRQKPFGELASRTVGIDRPSHRVGIEASWNPTLTGVEGKQLQRRISGGEWMPISDEFIVEPSAGLDLVTSIDMHLQDVASRALERQLVKHNAAWGTVVLMEVKTGYIRAIANLTRDGEALGDEVPAYYESYNHAIGSAVEPGSTFKLASLLSVLEAGADADDLVNTGNGITHFHGKRMSDSNADEGGHGEITLEEVFEVSSNVGTALTVKKHFGLEPQGFLDALHRMGIHEASGVNLVGEGNPTVYLKAGDGAWSGLSLTQMAIGYEVTQTPLQTLVLYNAVANGGTLVRPQLVEATMHNGREVERFLPEVVVPEIASAKTIAACQKMLAGVAEPDAGGTAENVFRGSPYSVAGKTGTAWIAEQGGYKGRYRASFCGYFPAESPRYSVIVVIADTRSGIYYGSSIAGPVFRELADKVYVTDASFHRASEGSLATESPRLPGSKDGARQELEYLYDAFSLDYERAKDYLGDWVEVKTGTRQALLEPLLLAQDEVPDVRGMGLRDALYLLENAGLSVKTTGRGTVRQQSIAPGSKLIDHTTITIELS